jgi:glycosyltransferase involved in cell wall biosynthesis
LVTNEKRFDLPHSYLISEFANNDVMSYEKSNDVSNLEKNVNILDKALELYKIDSQLSKENVERIAKLGNLSTNELVIKSTPNGYQFDCNNDNDFFEKLYFWKRYLYFENVVKRLPKHKAVVYGFRNFACADNEKFLNMLVGHHDSKIMYYAMQHEFHTGGCIFPDWHGCDKYQYEDGCYNCAYQAKKNIQEVYDKGKSLNKIIEQPYSFGMQTQQLMFNNMKKVVKKHKKRIRYLVSSSFTKKQAKKSFLFNDIDTRLAVLKIKDTNKDINKEDISKIKMAYKQELIRTLSGLEQYFDSNNIDKKDAKFVLWCSMSARSERKGIKEYIDICNIVSRKASPSELAKTIFVFSCNELEEYWGALPSNMISIYTGALKSKDLESIYNASDVYCCTTLEDAGPRTIGESLSHGTPVISFDKCIASDIINEKNGKIVKTSDTRKFADYLLEHIRKDKKQLENEFYESKKSFNEFYDEEKISKQWKEALSLDNWVR